MVCEVVYAAGLIIELNICDKHCAKSIDEHKVRVKRSIVAVSFAAHKLVNAMWACQ
jgi:hypothetical protein